MTLGIVTNAQETLGLKAGHYSGVNSLLLNPANGIASPFQWDVNLVAAGVHFNNNYAYIANTGLFDLLKNVDNLRLSTEVSPNQLQDNERLLGFF